MLGDVLLIRDIHVRAAEGIMSYVSQIEKEKVVIAISGESGSGKSELSHVLAKKLKESGSVAKIVHADNYYKVLPADRTAWRIKHGMDSIGLGEYDWDLLDEHVKAFLSDEHAVLPCIDLLTDQVDQLNTDFGGIRYLIVDGLYAIKVEADLRVFIDLTYQETKMSQLVRGKEPVNEFRMSVLAREHLAVRSLRPLADLIVQKDYEVEKA